MLRETAGPSRGASGRVIDAKFTGVNPGKRRAKSGNKSGWRAKLMGALVTFACVALAGLALPPLVMGAYILKEALTR